MKNLYDERKERISEFNKIARKRVLKSQITAIPDHIFVQCSNCLSALYNKVLDDNLNVCPYCNFHFKLGAKSRIELTVDENSFNELFNNIVSTNFLEMPEYDEKLLKAKEISKINEAIVTGTAKILNQEVAIAVLDSSFMMGSMGSVVGEKITLLIEHASKNKLPLIIFSASGGARMQEGIISLMQMAKTSGALANFTELYISVLTNPTTGGVAASFASLGDINIAEKSSLIGFAGSRVIKQTIQQDLPEGFQTENFQFNKGQVDLVLKRSEIRETLGRLLKFHYGDNNEK